MKGPSTTSTTTMGTTTHNVTTGVALAPPSKDTMEQRN